VGVAVPQLGKQFAGGHACKIMGLEEESEGL
jgi:hypothetical protein